MASNFFCYEKLLALPLTTLAARILRDKIVANLKVRFLDQVIPDVVIFGTMLDPRTKSCFFSTDQKIIADFKTKFVKMVKEAAKIENDKKRVFLIFIFYLFILIFRIEMKLKTNLWRKI